MAQGRSLTRFLAPLALVIVLIALVLVVQNATSGDSGGSGDSSALSKEQKQRKRERRAQREQRKVYVVKQGDTLAAIATQTKVPQDEIVRLNEDLDPQQLQPGQKIRLR